jgi:hypothetical protein
MPLQLIGTTVDLQTRTKQGFDALPFYPRVLIVLKISPVWLSLPWFASFPYFSFSDIVMVAPSSSLLDLVLLASL